MTNQHKKNIVSRLRKVPSEEQKERETEGLKRDIVWVALIHRDYVN